MSNGITFKVESYNMLVPHWADHEKPSLSGMSWDERKEKLAERMTRSNPDVICLQEVERFNDLQNCLERSGYKGIFAKRNNHEEEGCAIFYKTRKFGVVKTSTEFFNDGTGRMILHVELKPSNARNTFHVLNSHTVWDRDSSKRRLDEIHALQQLASSKSQAGTPTIVCGDLNTTRQGGDLDGFWQKGFVDTVHKAGNSWKNSFAEKDARGDRFFTTYDYIYAKNIEIANGDIDGDPTDLKDDFEKGTRKEPSDHLPVLADFKLPVERVLDEPLFQTLQQFEEALEAEQDPEALKRKFAELDGNLQKTMKWGFWMLQGLPSGDPDFGQTFFNKNPRHQTVRETIQLIKENGLSVFPSSVKEEIHRFKGEIEHYWDGYSSSSRSKAIERLSPIAQKIIKTAIWVKAGSPMDRGVDFAGDALRANTERRQVMAAMSLLTEKLSPNGFIEEERRRQRAPETQTWSTISLTPWTLSPVILNPAPVTLVASPEPTFMDNARAPAPQATPQQTLEHIINGGSSSFDLSSLSFF